MGQEDEQPDRRRRVWLTEAQLDEVAKRAAKRAIDEVYTEVGRYTVRAFLLVLGATVLVVLSWLGVTGKLPPR